MIEFDESPEVKYNHTP